MSGRRRALLGASVWVASVSASGAGCGGEAAKPAVCNVPTSSAGEAEALASANTAFAASFFAPASAAAGAGHNVIFSPYSVSATLAMVDLGAAGATREQIQSVLHLPGSPASVAPAYAALACANQTDGTSQGNQLSVANSVWAQSGVKFLHPFLTSLSGGYAAPLEQVDFASDPGAAAGAIDRWVSTQTAGKIPALLQPGDVDATTRVVLVNAVYFAGTWQTGFDPARTAPSPFTLSSGARVNVPMMSGAVTAGGATLQMKAMGPWITTLELPYEGSRLAMDIVMPGGSLPEFEAGLTAETLARAIASAASGPRSVVVSLPKFTFTTRVALAPVLAAMGVKDLFDPSSADLSGMDGERDLHVSRALEQAYVEVDEQGTIAAAASGGAIDPGATLSSDATTINQPFLFVVRDTTSGSILFLGHVEDPRQSS